MSSELNFSNYSKCHLCYRSWQQLQYCVVTTIPIHPSGTIKLPSAQWLRTFLDLAICMPRHYFSILNQKTKKCVFTKMSKLINFDNNNIKKFGQDPQQHYQSYASQTSSRSKTPKWFRFQLRFLFLVTIFWIQNMTKNKNRGHF